MHKFIGVRVPAYAHAQNLFEEFWLQRILNLSWERHVNIYGPPSHLWQASPWHLSDHCGAITAAPNVSISLPPTSSHLLKRWGLVRLFQNRARLSAPTQHFKLWGIGKRHRNPAVRCGTTWHCQDRGNGVESMSVSHYLILHHSVATRLSDRQYLEYLCTLLLVLPRR